MTVGHQLILLSVFCFVYQLCNDGYDDDDDDGGGSGDNYDYGRSYFDVIKN